MPPAVKLLAAGLFLAYAYARLHYGAHREMRRGRAIVELCAIGLMIYLAVLIGWKALQEMRYNW